MKTLRPCPRPHIGLVIPFLGIFLFTIVSTITLQGAAPPAPPNDTCAGAEVIPGAGPFPFATHIVNITSATSTGDPPKPSCLDSLTNVARSVWYSFTPAATRRYIISSCPSAPTATTVDDTLMAIYTSPTACGVMTQIPDGCNDDECGPSGPAAITANLTAGIRYYIVVWRWGIDVPRVDNSSVQLLVAVATIPDNDTCGGAIPLSLNQPVRGRTILAANDYTIAPSCFSGLGQRTATAPGRDVVYSFTAPETGEYSFRVNNFDTLRSDLVLYVIDQCPSGSPALITTCLGAANRTPGTATEEVYCVPLSANQNVFVIVDDNVATAPGSSFVIEASRCIRESEPNNTSMTANGIACGIEGASGSSGDIDFYSLGVPNAGSRLFAMIDGSAAYSSDFDLRAITLNGTLELDGGNNDVTFGTYSSNLAGTPLTNLPSFLVVERPAGLRTTEGYRLFAVIQPPLSSATVEVEPNNNLAQANNAPNNYFYGTLSTNAPPAAPTPSADVDAYRFDAESGDLVFISLDADPLRNNTGMNAALDLLDELGNVLVSVDDPAATSQNISNSSTNGNGSYSPGEALVFRVSDSASYFARVRISTSATAGSTGAGDYLLSISRNCVPNGDGAPLVPNVAAIVQLPNGNLQMTIEGTPGVAYRVAWSQDLSTWNIIPGSARTASGDGLCQYEFPNSASQRFYRAVWP